MKMSCFSCIISTFEECSNNKIQIFGSNDTQGKTSENTKSDRSKSWLIFDNIHDIQKFPQSMILKNCIKYIFYSKLKI